MNNDTVYYRVRASDGAVVTLQWFDEYDYDPSIWLKDSHGESMVFRDQQSALEEWRKRNKPKPKVLGYVVVGRDGKLTSMIEFSDKESALFLAKDCNDDLKDEGIVVDWKYRVAKIVELDENE